jgi:L-lactate dehydrogenase complex protein LldG
MTPDERARMRETLRAALGHARLPGGQLEHPGAFAPPSSAAAADLFARFSTELTALGGAVHELDSLEALLGLLQHLLEGRPRRSVLMWDEEWLPVQGLPTALVRAGISVDTQTPGDLASPDRKRELASATIGLTSADALIAETGSLVLVSGPGRGRLASLLPPVHVALVRRSAMVESLSVLFARRPELVTAGANFVCITGPSRTADIELTLSRGVHGPGEVHVVFVPDDPIRPQ